MATLATTLARQMNHQIKMIIQTNSLHNVSLSQISYVRKEIQQIHMESDRVKVIIQYSVI